MWGVELTLEAPRTVRATDASKRSPFWNFMLGHNNGLLEVMEGLSRSIVCANAQAFPTDGANCRDSIRNDPKMVLGSHVKGPNNIICRAWAERLSLGRRTVVSHGTHGGRIEVS